MAYTSRVGQQFNEKLLGASHELAAAGPNAVKRATHVIRQMTEFELRRVVPSGRLRNVGKSGSKLGVRYDIKSFSDPVAILRAVGPWHIIEWDTKAHRINGRTVRAKGRGSRRINRAQALAEVFGGTGAYTGKALKLPDGFRKVVSHPGTKGRHPFANGIERGKPLALRELRSATSSAVRRGIAS